MRYRIIRDIYAYISSQPQWVGETSIVKIGEKSIRIAVCPELAF